jgi:tetratricopeptide (TPR) repeat protein
MHNPYCRTLLALGIIAGLVLAGCSSPGEKRDNFMLKGKEKEEQKDFVRARLEYKNAVQVDPKCIDCYASLARTEMALQNPKGAYAAYVRAVELAPERSDLQIDLGRLLLIGKAPEKAEEKARLVLATDPQNLDAQLLLALALSVQRDKAKEALSVLDDFRQANPARQEGYILAARILAGQDDTADAKALLEKGMEAIQDHRLFLQTLLSIYAQENDWDGALATAKQLEALAPEEVNSYLTLARIYEQRGELGPAQEAWGKALEKDPRNQQLILAFAEFWARQKRHSEAEAVLRDGIAKDPSAFELRLALGRLLAMTGRGTEGMEELRKIQESDLTDPQRIRLMDEKARVLFAMGKLAETQELVSKILEKNPKDAGALFIQARLALAGKDGETAVSALRTLLDDAPDNMKYRLLLAQAHVLNGELKLAEDQLRQATQKAPSDQRPWQALASFYLLEKDAESAQAVLTEALGQIPDSAILHELQGRVRWIQGDQKGAETSFRRAMEIAPNWLIPYRDLASLLASAGKPGDAERNLKEAVAKYPEAPNLKILLATFYEQTAKPAQAIAIYEDLLAKSPDNPLICNNLAYLYAEYFPTQENIARAMDLVQRAEAGLPDKATILDTKAWIVFKSGNAPEALQLLEQALANMEHKHPTLLYHKGAILAAMGRRDEALTALQDVLEDQHPFPERQAAVRLMDEIKAGAAQTDKKTNN